MKLLLVCSLIGATSIAVSYFFGWRANMRKVSTTYWVLVLIGMVIMVGPMVHLFAQQEPSFSRTMFAVIAFVVGSLILLISPLVSSVHGIAHGETFEGPYQHMTPAEKQKFWETSRTVVRAGAGWVGRNERRKGNHGVADAAKYIKKLL